MDWTLIVVLLGAASAGFVQGVSGFAFSLVALSFWAWVLEPQLAAPMAVFGSLAGQLVTLPWVWRGFDLRRLLPLVVAGVAGVPIGVALLHWLDPPVFRFGLGCFLLLYSPLALLVPHGYAFHAGGRAADAAAGFAGGVLGGIGGMSGSIPTLWTTVRGWDKNLQRGVLQAFNIAMHVTTLMTYAATGSINREALAMFAWIAPVLALPAICGVLLFHKLSPPAFRRIVLVLLGLSGATLVAGSVGAVFR